MKNLVFIYALPLALFWSSALWAGGDHVDGHSYDDEAAAPVAPSAARSPALGQRFEGVLTYDRPAGEWRFYLSDWASNAPVAAAKIKLNLNGPTPLTADMIGAAVPGVYTLAAAMPATGSYSGIALVETTAATEVLAIPALTIAEEQLAHEGEDEHHHHVWPYALVAALAFVTGIAIGRRYGRGGLALFLGALLFGQAAYAGGDHVDGHSHDDAAPTPAATAEDGSLIVEKDAQFLIGIRTAPATERRLGRELRALGTVIAKPEGRAEIYAPQNGMLLAASEAGLPRLGQKVERGQTLAWLQVIDRLPLKAPLSGVISEVALSPGAFVEAGGKIFEIVDLSKVWVEAEIYPSDLALVEAASRAFIVADGYPNRRFQAKARGVSPVLHPQTRVAHALFEVDNRQQQLRLGMAVETWIEIAEDAEVLAAPAAAVLDDDGTPVVFVHGAAERFEVRRVALAGRYGEYVAIRDGISAGERVVVAGHWQLLALARKAGY